jgi:thiamine transporter ThiT
MTRQETNYRTVYPVSSPSWNTIPIVVLVFFRDQHYAFVTSQLLLIVPLILGVQRYFVRDAVCAIHLSVNDPLKGHTRADG